MGISKSNLRAFGSSLQSGSRSVNSKIINWLCVSFLASLILLGGSAKATPAPYNVLVNPGAETGDLTGWDVSSTGYIYVVSTNNLVPGTTNKFSAHSGACMFQMFDTTADSAYMYQDYPAAGGSEWSASVWAICYASNYFDSAIAYMSVAFYDTNGNVVLDDPINPDPGTVGVYGSVILDPNAPGFGVGWIIAPPPAIDASGWLYLPVTNFYYGYIPANTNGAPGINIESGWAIPASTNLTAPAGTAFVRYQLEFDNSSFDGGDVYWDDCVLAKLSWSDPDITNPQPASVTIYAGDPASFTVHATRAKKATIEMLTYQWQKNGTNLPPAGGVNDIQGATTNATLYFTDCQVADSGQFDVVVTGITTNVTPWVTNGTIRSVPVTLTVLPPSPSKLCDLGFEEAPSWGCWNIFNGAYLVCATNVYDTTTNTVNIFDGNWCAMVGENGDRDNGLWQAIRGVTPGTYWKAGGWAYISSLNDFVGGNTCRIQIWFKDANGNKVPGTPTYESFKIYGLAYTNADMQYTNIDTSSFYYGQVMYHDQLPRDQWVHLPVTNMVNNRGIGLADDLPTNTWLNGYFVVPTNTTPPVAEINYQVYEYCPVSFDVMTNGNGTVGPPEYLGVATDAVYWDDAELIQIPPMMNIVSISVSGTNVNLTVKADAGIDYALLYKTNLMDPVWSVLTNNIMVPSWWQTNVNRYNTGYPVTVIDPITAQSRFYRVQAQ